MNLLIPSVGRKGYLVEQLRAAMHRRGGRLFGADLSDHAPGMRHVDGRIRLPPFGSDGYWPAVEELLVGNDIGAVIPVRDAELAGWAERAEAGGLEAKVFLSPASTLRMCRDKGLLYRAACAVGIDCPAWEVFTADQARHWDGEFPVVSKPLSGAGSRGVSILRSRRQLAAWLDQRTGNILLQQYAGGPEYSIDCYALADGRLVACCLRERLLVRDGESVVGKVVDSPELVEVVRVLTNALRFRGVINIQVIAGADGPRLIDINPRFPGGIAITEAAGFRFIEWTVEELCGEPLSADGGSRRQG
jgi:carbamoyl-phosphate synthase large subunit